MTTASEKKQTSARSHTSSYYKAQEMYFEAYGIISEELKHFDITVTQTQLICLRIAKAAAERHRTEALVNGVGNKFFWESVIVHIEQKTFVKS